MALIDAAFDRSEDCQDIIGLSLLSCILEMTMALIDAAFDRSEDCQDIIGLSLFNLGKKRPELVLSSCNSYLKKHSKVSTRPQGNKKFLHAQFNQG